MTSFSLVFPLFFLIFMATLSANFSFSAVGLLPFHPSKFSSCIHLPIAIFPVSTSSDEKSCNFLRRKKKVPWYQQRRRWGQWLRRQGSSYWCLMKPAAGSAASRYVPFVLAVEARRAYVFLLLVAMQSAATFQIGPLASAPFFPRHAIVLDAISNHWIPLLVFILYFSLYLLSYSPLWCKCDGEEGYLFVYLCSLAFGLKYISYVWKWNISIVIALQFY